MHLEFATKLRCPRTHSRLELRDIVTEHDRIRSGRLCCPDCGDDYEIRDFIPRFVPASNYADSFGMQWNMFRMTQLDSTSGHPISATRFWKATNWSPNALKGHWVLDVGCGAGRFAEVALSAGAHVVALDYSSAIDACYANLRHHENFHAIQADIYQLPFLPQSFPFVYSLGVLQHTPDVARAFAALPPIVQPGGSLCVDVYARSWKTAIRPYYWLRPITKRMSKARLFSILRRAVPAILPMSRVLGRVPRVGVRLRRLMPVANYEGMLPLTHMQHLEWSLLDTFDFLAPEYDNPQTSDAVRRWFEHANMTNVEVLTADHLVGRGHAPA